MDPQKYSIGSLDTDLPTPKEEKDRLEARFLNNFRTSLKLLFWHNRRMIMIRPSFRAEMMHLELSLRKRHYIEALQISIKQFSKEDEKSFELVANAIKELGAIHSSKGGPEDKVWNY